MRLRSLTHRAASALLWAWFAAFFAMPAAWRPCPMHVSAGAAQAQAAVDFGGTHGAHGAYGGSTATPHDSEQGQQAPTHPCDCATDCCGAPAVVIAEPEVRIAAAAIRLVDAPIPATTPGIASARVRLLPFANAPPAA